MTKNVRNHALEASRRPVQSQRIKSYQVRVKTTAHTKAFNRACIRSL